MGKWKELAAPLDDRDAPLTYAVYEPLPPVGYWVVSYGDPVAGCTKFPTYSVPRWRHRYFMSLIFGWKWEDA